MSIILHHADCFDVFPSIKAESIDLILCDPPYGTTACKWDSVLPLDLMWENLERVIKPNGAIVLTASQPFTSLLVCSNLALFRYSLVWDKVNKYTGALNANKMPLRRHEDVLVFYKKLPTYIKQYRAGKAYKGVHTKGHGLHTQYGNPGEKRFFSNDGNHNPCSVIDIPADLKKELGKHPTQKPVALMEYFIKTYSLEGETVLDFTMGSGSTGVACKNLKRNFIGIEKEKDYYDIAKQRLLTEGTEQEEDALDSLFRV
jgi:site-specific DNA-methyltransferase (adenine-specific)